MNEFGFVGVSHETILGYKCPFLPNACASAQCWYRAKDKPNCVRGLGVQALKYAWHAGAITEEQFRELIGDG